MTPACRGRWASRDVASTPATNRYLQVEAVMTTRYRPHAKRIHLALQVTLFSTPNALVNIARLPSAALPPHATHARITSLSIRPSFQSHSTLPLTEPTTRQLACLTPPRACGRSDTPLARRCAPSTRPAPSCTTCAARGGTDAASPLPRPPCRAGRSDTCTRAAAS